ncbi:hypothetical protein O3P69_000305 [Scylla paramamosain]|uniref:Uncharacterized protein n=1 Tax=Scylla paramamosain TaxID=85552 RepID=A0AAW0V0N2_SCYPA
MSKSGDLYSLLGQQYATQVRRKTAPPLPRIVLNRMVCRVRGVERVTCRAGSPRDVGGVTRLLMVIVEWAVGEVVVIRDFRARKMVNDSKVTGEAG